MAVMWSRPHSLSLRDTWVTPATFCLAAGAAVVGVTAGALGLAAAARTGSLLLVALAVLSLLYASGAGTLAVYGMRQRLISRKPSA